MYQRSLVLLESCRRLERRRASCPSKIPSNRSITERHPLQYGTYNRPSFHTMRITTELVARVTLFAHILPSHRMLPSCQLTRRLAYFPITSATSTQPRHCTALLDSAHLRQLHTPRPHPSTRSFWSTLRTLLCPLCVLLFTPVLDQVTVLSLLSNRQLLAAVKDHHSIR